MKASRIGITLFVEEFNELVKLIPKIQDSIAQYKLHDIGPSPPPPLAVLLPPLIDPSLEKILSDLDSKENLVISHCCWRNGIGTHQSLCCKIKQNDIFILKALV